MGLIWWNAHVTVGGAKVGLGWRVVDDPADRRDYRATITVTLPNGPTFSLDTEHAQWETVPPPIRDPRLTCEPNAIQAEVTYLVTPTAGATGRRVEVKIAKVSGLGRATGRILAVGSGDTRAAFTVPVVIPDGSCT